MSTTRNNKIQIMMFRNVLRDRGIYNTRKRIFFIKKVRSFLPVIRPINYASDLDQIPVHVLSSCCNRVLIQFPSGFSVGFYCQFNQRHSIINLWRIGFRYSIKFQTGEEQCSHDRFFRQESLVIGYITPGEDPFFYKLIEFASSIESLFIFSVLELKMLDAQISPRNNDKLHTIKSRITKLLNNVSKKTIQNVVGKNISSKSSNSQTISIEAPKENDANGISPDKGHVRIILFKNVYIRKALYNNRRKEHVLKPIYSFFPITKEIPYSADLDKIPIRWISGSCGRVLFVFPRGCKVGFHCSFDEETEEWDISLWRIGFRMVHENGHVVYDPDRFFKKKTIPICRLKKNQYKFFKNLFDIASRIESYFAFPMLELKILETQSHTPEGFSKFFDTSKALLKQLSAMLKRMSISTSS